MNQKEINQQIFRVIQNIVQQSSSVYSKEVEINMAVLREMIYDFSKKSGRDEK